MSVRFSSLPGWILLGLLGLVAGCITTSPRPPSDPAGLVGRWEGLDDKGKHGVFVFTQK